MHRPEISPVDHQEFVGLKFVRLELVCSTDPKQTFQAVVEESWVQSRRFDMNHLPEENGLRTMVGLEARMAF